MVKGILQVQGTRVSTIMGEYVPDLWFCGGAAGRLG